MVELGDVSGVTSIKGVSHAGEPLLQELKIFHSKGLESLF